MAIRLAAGNDARIGFRPNIAGNLYGTGFLYMSEMSAESALEFSNSVTTQEVYGTTTAKNVGGIDEASFSFTAFIANTTGMVHRYNVTTPGTGYTTAPALALTLGGFTTAATAIAEINLAAGTVVGAWPISFGEGYTTAPTVTPSGGAGTGAVVVGVIGGDTLYALDLMFRTSLYMRMEFSPRGGAVASLRTYYTFDFTRESWSITPAVSGVISLSASGKAENITLATW